MDIKKTPSWGEYNEAIAALNADPDDADKKAAMLALWDTCLQEQAVGVEAEKTEHRPPRPSRWSGGRCSARF